MVCSKAKGVYAKGKWYDIVKFLLKHFASKFHYALQVLAASNECIPRRKAPAEAVYRTGGNVPLLYFWDFVFLLNFVFIYLFFSLAQLPGASLQLNSLYSIHKKLTKENCPSCAIVSQKINQRKLSLLRDCFSQSRFVFFDRFFRAGISQNPSSPPKFSLLLQIWKKWKP